MRATACSAAGGSPVNSPIRPLLRIIGGLFVFFIVFSAGVFVAIDRGSLDRLYVQSVASADSIIQRLVSQGLPESIPYSGHVTVDTGKAYPGYTLYTTDRSSQIFMVDMQGRLVHEWNLPFDAIWPNPTHIKSLVPSKRIYVHQAYLYPNGDVLAVYYATGDTPYGYGLAKIDKDSHLIWKVDKHIHHDVSVSADGTIYALSQDVRFDPIPGLRHIHYPALVDGIEIIAPDGVIKQTIPILEAFAGTPYEQYLYNDILLDWKGDLTHANSVMALDPDRAGAFPQFKVGQILVSVRNQHALAVIDPHTQKVVWATKGPWRRQHKASFLANGHILLFDNMGFHNGQHHYSRILEVNPRDISVSWHYTPDDYFYSKSRGSVQRLPNGNTMITESGSSRILEVTPDKQTVWRFELPVTDKRIIVESAVRIPYDGARFIRKDAREP